MNQNQKNFQKNSSIAWFKIARLIERREKEKALNIYRLLVHSLQDRAYALQLEGDILWALSDTHNACEKYLQSAFSYQNNKQWLDAVCLCEHIKTLDSENHDALILSILCYAQLNWKNRFEKSLDQISINISKNISDEKIIISIVKSLAESAIKIENQDLKNMLRNKLQEILSTLPITLVEKLEPFIKKYF